MNIIDTIDLRLKKNLKPILLEITDDSHKHIGHTGVKLGMGHYHVKIASDVFKNKDRITCHQMIYNILADLMNTKIHALSICIC